MHTSGYANAMDSHQTFAATVLQTVHLAGDYFLGRFSLVRPKEIDFTAGQYVVFHIPPPKRRHTMSIASPPSQRGEIEILQQRVPGGEGSAWFASLKAGDTVRFTGPLGRFTLVDSDRPKVFVATGSGIAPIRSMIRDALNGQRTGSGKPMTLYWGLRYETDIFWQDELQCLADKHQSFHYTITLSKSTDAWRGARGRVTEHVVAETPNLTEAEFYLCGSREMIADVRSLLSRHGVAAEQIVTEMFF